MGDEDFFPAFAQVCLPGSASGAESRWQRRFGLTSTDEFKQMTEGVTGKSLDWLFNVYLHQPALPELVYYVDDDNLVLEWITPVQADFPMPVPVRIGREMHHIFEMNEGFCPGPASW